MKNKAVFVDRDGVINELIYYEELGIVDSPFTASQIKVYPDVGKSIKKLQKLGFKIVLVSNQPGLAKGNFTMEAMEKMRAKMTSELKKQGVALDAEYYCFHHPYGKVKKYREVCECRKPKPGMLIQAAKDLDINLKESWMIGDGITDIQAGQAAGVKTIFVGRLKCDICKIMDDQNTKADFIAPNLYKAAQIIETEVKQ